MGYLVSGHIVREPIAIEALSALPDSVGRRLYRHKNPECWIIDAFRPERVPDYPFTQLTPTKDIPLETPIADLDAAAKAFRDTGHANAFKRGYVNLALIVAKALGSRTLSFVADDDELDFSCIASPAGIERVSCLAGDILLIWETGKITVEAFSPEFEEDADFLTDLLPFRDAIPSATFIDRERQIPSDLHAQIRIEIARFLGVEDSIIGIGDFDPYEEDSIELVSG